jgi:PAP2 superfamily
MHIAQPLIVMWFLRRWKRIVIALCAYDVLLIVAILFLEWHYLVDILAGMLVAVAAIAIIGSSSWADRQIRTGSDVGLREGALPRC